MERSDQSCHFLLEEFKDFLLLWVQPARQEGDQEELRRERMCSLQNIVAEATYGCIRWPAEFLHQTGDLRVRFVRDEDG